MRMIVGFVVLIILILSTSIGFADNSVRIQELENNKMKLESDLRAYQADTERRIKVAEVSIWQIVGAINELTQQDKEEKNAIRKAESDARKTVRAHIVESGDNSERDSDGLNSEGSPRESASPESGPSEEGQEGETDTPSS